MDITTNSLAQNETCEEQAVIEGTNNPSKPLSIDTESLDVTATNISTW